jgi:hypothetical protein
MAFRANALNTGGSKRRLSAADYTFSMLLELNAIFVDPCNQTVCT